MLRHRQCIASLLLALTLAAYGTALGQIHTEHTSVEALPKPTPELRLDLAHFEGLALRYNPTLATAAARIAAARGQRIQSGLYPNPVIGYHATEIANQGTAGQQGGFVSQRFVTGGKLSLDRAVAAKGIEVATVQFRIQQQRVLSDVQTRFYDAAIAERRLQVTQRLAKTGNDLVQATATLLKARLATENDLLQAEIKADQSHILVDNARNEHLEAWRRLAAVVGMPQLLVSPLSAHLEADLICLRWEDCYARLLTTSPEIWAAQARVERAAFAVRRARRQPIPNVDLSVSVRHHNVPQDNVANVQLGIPLPVFDRNQGNIRSAHAEWIAANNEVKRIELLLQERLATVFRRYSSAQQQVDRYRQRILSRAEKSLEMVTSGYEKGQVEYLTLLNAQQTYLQVNLSYLKSLRELRSALSVIQGQLLTDSLATRP